MGESFDVRLHEVNVTDKGRYRNYLSGCDRGDRRRGPDMICLCVLVSTSSQTSFLEDSNECISPMRIAT